MCEYWGLVAHGVGALKGLVWNVWWAMCCAIQQHGAFELLQDGPRRPSWQRSWAHLEYRMIAVHRATSQNMFPNASASQKIYPRCWR